MSQSPSLQTVATLSSGTSPVLKQAFVWGVAGRPFSVGTRADWVVEAPGVEAMHLFLNFDGRMLQVASGPTGASATLNGAPIDHNWQPVAIYSEIAFGGARIRVTCEEAPQQTSVPPPNPAPFEPAAAPAPQPLEQTAYVRPRQLKTQPLNAEAQQARAQVYGRQEQTLIHVAQGPAQPYGAAPHASAAPQAGVAPHPGQLGSQPPPGAQPAPYAAVPTSPPFGLAPTQPEDVDRDGASTLSDAGALRAHASRVATDPGATHSAYHAHVQRAAGSYDSAVPPGAAAGYGESPPAAGAPYQPASPPPRTLPSAAPMPAPDAAATDAGTETKPQKEKTSWVMRVVLVLLPFAGYFAIFWEPPANDPPAESASAVDESADETNASASASPGSQGGAVTSATASAQAVAAGASANPNGAASSSAPSVASSAEVASPSPAEKGTAVVAAAGSTSPAGSAIPQSPKLAREALNAAFEGRLDEATQRYERLSANSESEIYRLSVRLLRERAVRKP